ncbi:MAG: threonine/serine ThrE exporter family protein [Actinomycetes bacterium]
MPQPDRPGRYRASIQARATGMVRRRHRPGRYSAEPVHLPEPDERQAYRVLNLALRAGEVLLAGGAGASDVTATVMAAANACGLERVEVDVTFTTIAVSYVRTAEVAPVTAMRTVRRRSLDYTRVTEVHNLVADLMRGRVAPDAASARLDVIRHAPHPYPRWATTVFLLGMAACLIASLGGGPLAAAVGACITVVVDRVSHRLSLRSVPQFFQHAFGAAIATSTAALLVAVGVPLSSSIVVAGGIILLLPGVALVGCVHDAITGYLVTAGARAMEVLVLTAGIIAGVGVALSVAVSQGVSVSVAEPSVSFSAIPLQVLAAGGASVFYALSTYSPRRLVPSIFVTGGLGWGVFQVLQTAGAAHALATGAASTFVGVSAFVLSRRQQVPPLVLVAAGIVPLLPGLTIYRGMFALAESTPFVGMVMLVQAVAIGMALAAGAILGEYLVQPSRSHVHRFERGISGPRLAGPLRWRDEDDEDTPAGA